MKRLLLAGLIALGVVSPARADVSAREKKTPAELVEVLAGTSGSRWIFFSSACRPFGMVQLSPDTATGGDWMNGYIYDKKRIRCFSHLHGWQEYGIATMPFTGAPQGHLGMDAYGSDFSHKDEVVHPGYHKVVLSTYGVTAELTSTMRVGFHRYTFPADKEGGVLIDTGAVLMDKIQSSEVRRVSDTEVEGTAVMAPTFRRPKPWTVWFTARFDRPMKGFGTWKDKQPQAEGVVSVSGKNAGGFATFTASDKPLLVKVSVSFTGLEGARRNLEEELPHWDFDRVVADSAGEWNRWLGKITVEGGTELERARFYTDCWHALLGRRTVSDVDGAYIDNTGDKPRVRRVRLDDKGKPLFPHYNFDAFWGAHWSVNLFWSLAYPEIIDGHCNTMLDMYRNGGLIPRGPSGGNYTFVMIGDPAASLFSAAWHKGIRNFDPEKAYEGLRKNAFPGGIRDHAGYEFSKNATSGGMTYYVGRGYVPEGIKGGGGHKAGASMTLEYAWQDWCLGQFAASLGKTDDAVLFAGRARNYEKIWDPEIRWMRPREIDGSFMKNYSPVQSGGGMESRGFCEGNGAIYTHFVPQDPAGLAKLFGGPDKYAEALDAQFERAKPSGFIVPHGTHGAAWVDYENEPGFAMAYMFNMVGKPWLSQKWVTEVRGRVFSDITPKNGYHGDEDEGMMGSVGALMAMGLFDVQGGCAQRPTWQITPPVFDRVTIRLNEAYATGKTFVIVTRHRTPENRYIQSARLNGKPLANCWIYHEDLAKGGVLELELGPRPNKSWGVTPPPY